MAQQLVYWDEATQKYVTLKPGEAPPQGAVVANVPATPSILPIEQDIAKPAPADLSQIQPRDVVTGGLRAAGAVIPMIMPGTSTGMMLARGALGAGIPSAAAAKLEGGSPLDEATFQTALGAGGETLGKAFPYVSNALSLAIGNVRHPIEGLKGLGKTTAAFTRHNLKNFPPVLVGRANKMKLKPLETVMPSSEAARQTAGEVLEQAENASPVKTSLRDLAGSNSEYMDEAVNTKDPLGLRGKISETERTFIQGQALARKGWTEGEFEKRVTQAYLSIMRSLAQQGLNNRQIRQALAQNGIGTLSDFRTLAMDSLINSTELSARELGNLQRGMSAEAAPVIQKRGSGEHVTTGERQDAQMVENMMGQIRDIRHGPVDVGSPQTPFQKLRGADPKPGQAGSIKASDRAVGDTIKMDQANKSMRAGGIPADLGMIAIRASLGNMVARAVGMDPTTVSLLAAFGLQPQALSGAGYLAGRTAQAAPPVIRLWNASDSTQGVKRRKNEEKK